MEYDNKKLGGQGLILQMKTEYAIYSFTFWYFISLQKHVKRKNVLKFNYWYPHTFGDCLKTNTLN